MQPAPTECTRAVLVQAQSEARALNQDYVGTEHLLLALLASKSCQAARIMQQQHVDRDAVRTKLVAMMERPDQPPVVSGDLPLSPKAQKCLNHAIVIAQSLRESKISTRIFLLALLSEDATPFTTALKSAGVDVEALNQALATKPTDVES